MLVSREKDRVNHRDALRLDDALLLTHTVGQVLIRDCQRRGNGGFGDGIFGSDSAAQMALAAGAETVAGAHARVAAVAAA
eukprot:6200887-Pleurochrysis_carterae.AAC.1